MKTSAFVAAVAALAVRATPLVARQEIDFDLLDSVPDPIIVTVDVLTPATTITYDLAAATAAALAGPLGHKRDLEGLLSKRTACEPQLEGKGPKPEEDSPEAFVDFAEFAVLAKAAQVPAGYKQTFINLKGSNSAYAYMGYTQLDEYNPATCAAKCDAIKGCSGINLYFERAPVVEPAPSCPDPDSTTLIRCVFWGGYVGEVNANNVGQWRDEFHVVIAGSNGYMRDSVPKVGGYTGIGLGDASVNAPSNCNGEDTYLGVKVFTAGVFDPALCAAACSALDRPCRFFVTYIGHLGGRPEGQICAMYSQSWDKSFADNVGQWRGDEYYSVNYSFAYWNTANPGFPAKPTKKL